MNNNTETKRHRHTDAQTHRDPQTNRHTQTDTHEQAHTHTHTHTDTNMGMSNMGAQRIVLLFLPAFLLCQADKSAVQHTHTHTAGHFFSAGRCRAGEEGVLWAAGHQAGVRVNTCHARRGVAILGSAKDKRPSALSLGVPSISILSRDPSFQETMKNPVETAGF